MCCTAAAACPVSVCQCEVIFYETTNAASFTGWIPLIDFGKSLSLRCELILKHRAKHTKTIVVSGFAKLQRASHTTKVYIFHKHGIILLGYRSTQRMAEVLSLVGCMLLQKANLMQLLVIVVGTKLHMRQLTLFFCKFNFSSTVKTWIISCVTVAVYIKIMGGII